MSKEHDTNDNFSGIFIPRFVLEDKRLGHLDRILFGLIDGLAKSERGFFASNGFCSRILSVSPRRIQMSLKTLDEAALISKRIRFTKKPFSAFRTISTISSQRLADATRPGREENFAPPAKETSPPPRRKLRVDSKEDRKEERLSSQPSSRPRKIRVDTTKGF